MLSFCTTINAPVKSSKNWGSFNQNHILGNCDRYWRDDRRHLTREKSRPHFINSVTRRKDRYTKYQLLSSVGKLSFACKGIPAGRIFFHCLLDLSCKLKRTHHHCRLTTEACLDLDGGLPFSPSGVGHPTSWRATGLHPINGFVHGCLWHSWLGGILGWSLDSSLLVARSNWKRHCMEGAICHSLCGEHLGSPLA